MNIQLYRLEGSIQMLELVMSHCWGRSPKNIGRLFRTHDSIMLIPEYYALCTAPRSVALQLETHKKKDRFYAWLESSRPDIGSCPGEYSREQEINFAIVFTAKAIRDISHLRLCRKAENPTRRFMLLLKEQLSMIEPDLARTMVPLCVYRNGICEETRSCGMNRVYGKIQPLDEDAP